MRNGYDAAATYLRRCVSSIAAAMVVYVSNKLIAAQTRPVA